MIGQTAAEMRAHLDQFSGRLSAGLSTPARRFVAQALYGIAARGSVHLSEIGRALEATVPLAKTETRLSRNLGVARYATIWVALSWAKERQDRQAHASGPGPLGHRQALRPEDEISGPGARRQQRRAR